MEIVPDPKTRFLSIWAAKLRQRIKAYKRGESKAYSTKAIWKIGQSYLKMELRLQSHHHNSQFKCVKYKDIKPKSINYINKL